MTEYRLKIVSDHLLIGSEGGLLLVDTGSPVSFSTTGIISIGEDRYDVPTSLMNVDAAYISRKVGAEIVGLLGMDIISKYDTLIDVPHGKMTFGCDITGMTAVPTFGHHGCIGVKMIVEDRVANVFLDTGAPVSYINDSFTDGHEAVDTATDFSPMSETETFETPIYELKAEFGDCIFPIRLGSLPGDLSFMLSALGADGAVGMELLKRFPVAIADRQIYIGQ